MDGEWKPPVIQNPECKGKWKPCQVDNPDYKGTWIYPEIDNPEYSPVANIYAYDSFAVLGLDLWQVRHRKDKGSWQTSSQDHTGLSGGKNRQRHQP